ncbi:SRPBCC family protein [Chryseolinea lacunae]|uniref:SRPBCC family protein n=1 Tax=Chryseolinea lacunae TaxID=2801331 RepID=A0ABS1KXM3_9BACT|nr:SRPBCC family protein [Chryseolinea lacunae]MBL0743437.1 SRPBCC family protein [Chryseolinea lacunae]
MKFRNEIIINRSIEDVFKFLSDFENLSKWNYYVMKVNKITEGPVAVGAVYHQSRKTDAQDFRIVAMDSPTLLALETLPPERYLLMRFTLVAQGSSTKIIDDWDLEASWFVRWLAKNKVQSAVMDNLQKLKTLLETGTVTLQDGRVEQLH